MSNQQNAMEHTKKILIINNTFLFAPFSFVRFFLFAFFFAIIFSSPPQSVLRRTRRWRMRARESE